MHAKHLTLALAATAAAGIFSAGCENAEQFGQGSLNGVAQPVQTEGEYTVTSTDTNIVTGEKNNVKIASFGGGASFSGKTPDANLLPGTLAVRYVTAEGAVLYEDDGGGKLTGSIAGFSGSATYATGEFSLSFSLAIAGDVFVSYLYNYVKP